MGHGGVAEPERGQRIEPVRVAAGIERVRHQLYVVVIAHGDAGLRQHHGIELDVESDLEDPCRFQERPQRAERVGCLDLVRRKTRIEQPGAAAGLLVGERHIAGIVRRQGQRDAADIRPHRID